MRRALVAAALLTGLASTGLGTPRAGEQRRPSKERKVVFFFFVRGKASRAYAEGELKAMQEQHLANLRRLHEAGILSMAGPCADPGQAARGIVLLALPHTRYVAEHFREDPFVREGLLAIEPFKATAPLYELGTPADTGVDQHTIAIFEQADPHARPVTADVLRYERLPADQRPAVAVAAAEPSRCRLVLFFRTPNVDEVKPIVEADPLVRTGRLKVSVWQQWLGKGTLAPTPR